ncbi:MAG: hypothetical protein R3B57_07870 [Phycisphaerales bacterium]
MRIRTRILTLAAFAGAVAGATPAFAGPLVYEGRLSYLSAPVDSTADLRFRLFDAAQGGAQIGDTIETPAAKLNEGAFRVSLDFGDRVSAAWLEVSVRAPAGEGDYVTLSPRQLVEPGLNFVAGHTATSRDAAPISGAKSGARLSTSSNTPHDPVLDPAGGFDPNAITLGSLGSDRPDDNIKFGPAGVWVSSGANVIYQFGNVGIGTGSPSMPLTVNSSTAAQSILATNTAMNGRGVTGLATGNSGANFGVFGISFSPGGTGVFGQANHGTGVNYGVTGTSGSTNGTGVRGLATSATGASVGIFGQAASATGWPGFFEGVDATFDQDVGIRDGLTVFKTNSTNTLIRLVGKNGLENSSALLELGSLGNSGFVETPFNIYFVMDNDNTSASGQISFYEDDFQSGNELMRVQAGEGAAVLGDGAFTANGIDYAEAFRVAHDGLEPGDVVTMVRGDWEHIELADVAYDDMLVGVVSERPSFIAGMSFEAEARAAAEIGVDLAQRVPVGQSQEQFESARHAAVRAQLQHTTRPIALAGRVPVKVDASYGPIHAGDRLTSSPTPGHAMVQTRPGPSIGIALENFAQGEGKIIVLIQPGWTGLSDQQYEQLESRNAELEARIEALEQLITGAP